MLSMCEDGRGIVDPLKYEAFEYSIPLVDFLKMQEAKVVFCDRRTNWEQFYRDNPDVLTGTKTLRQTRRTSITNIALPDDAEGAPDDIDELVRVGPWTPEDLESPEETK